MAGHAMPVMDGWLMALFLQYLLLKLSATVPSSRHTRFDALSVPSAQIVGLALTLPSLLVHGYAYNTDQFDINNNEQLHTVLTEILSAS